MTNNKAFAMIRYREARKWLDDHRIGQATRSDRLLMHRVADYWGRQLLA